MDISLPYNLLHIQKLRDGNCQVVLCIRYIWKVTKIRSVRYLKMVTHAYKSLARIDMCSVVVCCRKWSHFSTHDAWWKMWRVFLLLLFFPCLHVTFYLCFLRFIHHYMAGKYTTIISNRNKIPPWLPENVQIKMVSNTLLNNKGSSGILSSFAKIPAVIKYGSFASYVTD